MKFNPTLSLLLLGAFTAATPVNWKRQVVPSGGTPTPGATIDLDRGPFYPPDVWKREDAPAGEPTPGSTIDRDYGPGYPPDVWKREASPENGTPKPGPTIKPDWLSVSPAHGWKREAAPHDDKSKPGPTFRRPYGRVAANCKREAAVSAIILTAVIKSSCIIGFEYSGSADAKSSIARKYYGLIPCRLIRDSALIGDGQNMYRVYGKSMPMSCANEFEVGIRMKGGLTE
ncbi:hypothetical protein TWF506_009669 [Arthrobotrys conoides]|uniref:Uncharacterized protein n=1 Tax=Arthrobotrys conoides TaxID=74498 RepID=A0AAN8NBY2_9PEZI